MRALLLLTMVPVLTPVLAQVEPGFPSYSAGTIANTAANLVGWHAPNTFVSIYGRNLAFVTRAIGADDIRANELPTVLLGTGVRVLLNNLPANVYYVSPNQVNILIPVSLTPGRVTLQLVSDAHAGPAVDLTLDAVAPALFEVEGALVVATHLNGSLITAASPASPGEIVVLWASGLGPTVPEAVANRIPQAAASLADFERFQVTLAGQAVARADILYAGAAPGFAGLFQINLRLPAAVPQNPEVRVGFPGRLSPEGRKLPFAVTSPRGLRPPFVRYT